MQLLPRALEHSADTCRRLVSDTGAFAGECAAKAVPEDSDRGRHLRQPGMSRIRATVIEDQRVRQKTVMLRTAIAISMGECCL